MQAPVGEALIVETKIGVKLSDFTDDFWVIASMESLFRGEKTGRLMPACFALEKSMVSGISRAYG
jgi:hypothetical protein